jgi:hypothetical protein
MRINAAAAMSAADGSSSATPYRRLSEPAYRGEFVARYDQLRPTG